MNNALKVVDVREDYEWDAGHVPGSTHIPLDRLAEHRRVPRSDWCRLTLEPDTAADFDLTQPIALTRLSQRTADRRAKVEVPLGGVTSVPAAPDVRGVEAGRYECLGRHRRTRSAKTVAKGGRSSRPCGIDTLDTVA